MGVCGCCEFNIDKGFKLPDGTEITYSIYKGCKDCFAGPAVDISIFTSNNDWTGGYDLCKFTPSCDGGEPEGGGLGIPVPLFEVRDLIAAVKEIGDEKIEGEYGFMLSEWLEECGFDMLQRAMQIFEKRKKWWAK